MKAPEKPAEEHRHKHVEIGTLLRHITKPSFSPEEEEAMKSAQWPDVFLICCIDSRFQPAKALDYGPGVALEYRPIAAVVPPEAEAEPALLARMAFRRVKDVRNIVVIAHSDCGGAQASINVAHPDAASGQDIDLIAGETYRTGLDVPKLRDEFLKAANGDARLAGNMLAKEVAVQSFRNLMGYKGRDGFDTIADEVKAGQADVALLYYDLETQKVEKYDHATGKWQHLMDVDPAPPPPIQPPPAAHRPPAP